jgi:hypothetical protein
MDGFGAISASRGWRLGHLNTHSAFYEFNSLSDAKVGLASDVLEKLVNEFDRRWNRKIIRT